MSLYYFQVLDDQAPSDAIGTELPDVTAARTEAIRLAAEILKGHAQTLRSLEEWQLKVTDESGLTLFTLLFMVQDAPSTRRDSGCNR